MSRREKKNTGFLQMRIPMHNAMCEPSESAWEIEWQERREAEEERKWREKRWSMLKMK